MILRTNCRRQSVGACPERSFRFAFLFSNMLLQVGIIGGTGLEDPHIFENAREVVVKTPFGDPSDALLEGEVGGIPCVLLSRHGRKHGVPPSTVNFRANLWALMERGMFFFFSESFFVS